VENTALTGRMARNITTTETGSLSLYRLARPAAKQVPFGFSGNCRQFEPTVCTYKICKGRTMLIVHVGLGKTATTTLQRYVFRELTKLRPDLKYNESWVIKALNKHHLFGLNDHEIEKLRRYFAGNTCLVSLESLVNWNPRLWEHAANRNLELFGSKAVMVITVREPISYLTSVFQQKVHEGNVKAPSKFLVNKSTYDKVSRHLPDSNLECFDVDAFDLRALYGLYQERFENVHMLPIGAISEFKFLEQPFRLSTPELETLKNSFLTAKRANRGYSAIAMRLTFWREKLLNIFGLKSIGSSDVDVLDLYSDLENLDVIHHKAPGRFRWRKLMQSWVNKCIPYKKYRLPLDLYTNDVLTEKNRQFIKEIQENS
jgi:hypothetical protein